VYRSAAAADLQARTSDAYDAYLAAARRAFPFRDRPVLTPPPQSGVLSAGPAREDGIVRVPGGLVHHWRGAAFVRGATLRTGLAVSSAFDNYNAVYKAVIRSSLLARSGDRHAVLMRLEEGEAGVRAGRALDRRVRLSAHGHRDRAVTGRRDPRSAQRRPSG
jgi:hypothetical protein